MEVRSNFRNDSIKPCGYWVPESNSRLTVPSMSLYTNEKLIAHLGVEAMMKETDTIIRGVEGERVVVKGAIELKVSYGE